jgi:hypothetical protein
MRASTLVKTKVCEDGRVVRWRRCLQCDSLIVFAPGTTTRQTCDIKCKRALFYARHRASGMTEYKAQRKARRVGRGPLEGGEL